MKTLRFLKASVLVCLMLMLTGTAVRSQELKDIDGNAYQTAKHGLQVWTASNLNVAHFRNGDAIPEAKTSEEWESAGKSGTPAWCYYENDTANGSKYGKLYNWYAINDKRGLAPDGWHIPGNADWNTLVKNLMGVDIAGTRLKSADDWKTKRGTNNIGFSAIPGGYREPDGKFRDLGEICQWWSNSVPVDVKPSQKIFSLRLSDSSAEVSYLESEKGTGLSVRCEKD